MIKRLENEGKISEKEYELIYPRGSRPGVLYGSPKVNKPVINNCSKFRPILSTIGTPTYKLAKFLVPILSPLTSNEFSVHDSFSFADKVSSFCPDHFMASLDIENLFTNIPLNEVIDICIDDLFCDTNTIQNLDRNDMRELLNLAAYESFFIFDQVMYRQNKLIVLQWVPHWVRFSQMHFYVILKNNGFQNALLIFCPKSLRDMLMIFL